MDANGNFVAVWQDDASGYITGRRFDDVGTPLSGEFVVAPFSYTMRVPASRSRRAAISSSCGGSTATSSPSATTAWGDRWGRLPGQHGRRLPVRARRGLRRQRQLRRRLVLLATARASKRSASTAAARSSARSSRSIRTRSATQYYPAIAMHQATGDFVVVWADAAGLDGDSVGVFGQRFASDGSTQGTEFQVNTYTYRQPEESGRRGRWPRQLRGRLDRRVQLRDPGRIRDGRLRAALRQQRRRSRHRVPGQHVHILGAGETRRWPREERTTS